MKKAFLLIAVLLLAIMPLASQGIKVIEPVGNFNICSGCLELKIDWIALDVPNNIYIHLRKTRSSLKSPPVLVLASGPVGTAFRKPLLWKIPCSIAPGFYVFRVGAVGTYLFDDSDWFEIKSCLGIHLVSSSMDGMALESGSTQTIYWEPSCCMTGTVKLILLQNGNYMGGIAKGLPRKGTFPWKVGQTDKGDFTGTGFSVRVIKEYGPAMPKHPLMDESGKFSILGKIVLR